MLKYAREVLTSSHEHFPARQNRSNTLNELFIRRLTMRQFGSDLLFSGIVCVVISFVVLSLQAIG